MPVGDVPFFRLHLDGAPEPFGPCYATIEAAIAAHNSLSDLPDGAVRIVDELGLVHATLYTPPAELGELAAPDILQTAPGIIESIVLELQRVEDDLELRNESNRDDFFKTIEEARRLVNQLEARGMELFDAQLLDLLIVEDDVLNARAIKRIARTLGYRDIVNCGSLATLRELIETGIDPAVVVCDYELPDGSGIGAQLLLKNHASQHVLEVPQFIAHSSNLSGLESMDGVKVRKGDVEGLREALREAAGLDEPAPNSL